MPIRSIIPKLSKGVLRDGQSLQGYVPTRGVQSQPRMQSIQGRTPGEKGVYFPDESNPLINNPLGGIRHKKKKATGKIKDTGKFEGKSNKLGHGGRAAQLKARGVPGGVIGELARAAHAAPGQKNYHGHKKHKTMKTKKVAKKMCKKHEKVNCKICAKKK